MNCHSTPTRTAPLTASEHLGQWWTPPWEACSLDTSGARRIITASNSAASTLHSDSLRVSARSTSTPTPSLPYKPSWLLLTADGNEWMHLLPTWYTPVPGLSNSDTTRHLPPSTGFAAMLGIVAMRRWTVRPKTPSMRLVFLYPRSSPETAASSATENH